MLSTDKIYIGCSVSINKGTEMMTEDGKTITAKSFTGGLVVLNVEERFSTVLDYDKKYVIKTSELNMCSDWVWVGNLTPEMRVIAAGASVIYDYKNDSRYGSVTMCNNSMAHLKDVLKMGKLSKKEYDQVKTWLLSMKKELKGKEVK